VFTELFFGGSGLYGLAVLIPANIFGVVGSG
jgi:hypothetical protein